MGDRGNIVIRQRSGTNREDVWFYTHWQGYKVQQVAQEALKRKERWGDSSYLARIVFCTLCKELEEATGYGISCCMGDNSYQIVVIDDMAQLVYLVSEAKLTGEGNCKNRIPDDMANNATKYWTYDEFIADKLGDPED